MGRRKRLWRILEEVCLKNYELLRKHTMRGTLYVLRDLIMPYIEREELTEKEYLHLATDQGYATYRDDFWPSLEQKHGLERPEVSSNVLFFDRGSKELLEKFDEIWKQARGFVFIEKEDTAKYLRELSKYGWVVIWGRGYPEREMRRLLKEDKRPVATLHDFDPDGEGIYRAMGVKTRRTKHLGIDLEDRVADLGLNREQVETLNLPWQLAPLKYQARGIKNRVELSALDVLTTHMGIDNPVMAFTVAAMLAQGVKIAPTSIPKEEALKAELAWHLRESIGEIIENTAKKYSKVEGEAVNVELPEAKRVEVPELVKELDKLASQMVSKAQWITEADYEAEARKLTDSRLTKLLK